MTAADGRKVLARSVVQPMSRDWRLSVLLLVLPLLAVVWTNTLPFSSMHDDTTSVVASLAPSAIDPRAHGIAARDHSLTPPVSLADRAPQISVPVALAPDMLRDPDAHDTRAVSAIESVSIQLPPRAMPKHDAPEAPVICLSVGGPLEHRRIRDDSVVSTPALHDFGLALARAARDQLGELVIYNPKYRSMRYPMGDVGPLYGVCTDVVIRAYRRLGIDLQVLVALAKLGRGDPSIDHRRVEVLRRFFAQAGASLPITDFAEDYAPGDIVTYWRPQSRVSQTHIAIVTDLIAPSGRPMVVHNRGWGPLLEDALFVDQITGHYRYTGEPSTAPRAPVVAADEEGARGPRADPIPAAKAGEPAPIRSVNAISAAVSR